MTQPPVPTREALPEVRDAVTHRFNLGADESRVSCYLTVGMYPDGRPGEIFLRVGKQGTAMRGMCDAWSRSISLLLQYGVPIDAIGHKFAHFSFEPSGWAPPPIGRAQSIVDYVARWLVDRFGEAKEKTP